MIAGLAVALYVAAAVLMFVAQRSLLFVPDTTDVTPYAGELPGAQAIVLTTTDGERLNAWWKPPADDQAAVYLYLHGNGANLTRRIDRFRTLTEKGRGLLALSWRGYGGSSGSPSEAGLRLDADAAFDFVASHVTPERIIVFGESLGTGVAVHLAASHAVGAVVLDSPYASIVDIAADRYPWLPVGLLARDPFRSIAEAPAVTEPLVAVHCSDDPVIPLAHARRLVAAIASHAKTLTVVQGHCHVPDIRQGLLPMLDTLQR